MRTIAEILDCRESYKLPDLLLQTILDDQKRPLLLAELAEGLSIQKDTLRDNFQQEHGDREKLKQDYTPDCLTELVAKLTPDADNYADICAGTGALTIANAEYHDRATKYFYCEEMASRAIPFLLTNLALRNLTGQVVQCNALTNESEKVYALTASEKFSTIQEALFPEPPKCGAVIMNPPYSIKWTPPTGMPQYAGYEPLPTNAADWAFVLHGLFMLEDGGTLIAVLPHGVLFRGNKEGKLRKRLIENNLIDAIIGVPDKMFMNTSIPVCLVVLKKNRLNRDILFINADKEFRKDGKQNILTAAGIEKILDVYESRREVAKFSSLATPEKLKENDYNLNIPRYVDCFEPPKTIPLETCTASLLETCQEIRKTELALFDMLKEINGTNAETDARYKKAMNFYKDYLKEKWGA